MVVIFIAVCNHAAFCYTFYMLHIHIKTIPDKEQRYDTVGDYQESADGVQHIMVSKMDDDRYEFLIALHELIESYLCKTRNISEAAIDTFDISYEKSRAIGDTISEPGNDTAAPYHLEHMFATSIEKLMASELDVDWQTYSDACARKMQN